MKKGFYQFWLAMGLLQTLAFVGCSGASLGIASAPPLLSSGPNPSSNSIAPNSESAGSPQLENSNSRPDFMPVRFSRSFFEKSLQAKVEIQSEGSSSPLYQADSSLSWEDRGPNGPAPQGDYLADYRAHDQCATLHQASGAILCFTLEADVSTVSMTGELVKLTGFEAQSEQTLATKDNHCSSAISGFEFLRASKTNTSVTAIFKPHYESGTNCPENGETVAITLSSII